jgi:hypothetical protein
MQRWVTFRDDCKLYSEYVQRAVAFRRRQFLTRAVRLWRERAVWKIHIFKANIKAVQHFRAVHQSKYLAHVRFSLYVERRALQEFLRHLKRFQMKIALHQWLGKAFGVSETHWSEFEQFYEMTMALTRIQAWWRGWAARRMILEDITMRTIAAIRIQTNWRGKAGRLALRRLVRLRLLTVGAWLVAIVSFCMIECTVLFRFVVLLLPLGLQNP